MVAKPSRDGTPGALAAVTARARHGLRRHRQASAARLPSRRPTTPNCSTPRIADRVVRRPAGRRARAHLRPAGSAPATASTAWCSAAWSRASGRRKRAADPWLSRPMRHALGLDLPERRIGLVGARFRAALGAREVILTRAGQDRRRADGRRRASCSGSPRSRAKRAGSARVERGEHYLACARAARRSPTRAASRRRGRRRRRRSRRGRRGSRVTEIEHWLRDPYTIYAKHVLKLPPLDQVDTPPGAADRGSVIHAAIGEFAKRLPARLPADPHARADRARPQPFRRARGFPGSARVLVAALRAHRRAGSPTSRRERRTGIAAAARPRSAASLTIPTRRRQLHADRRAPTASSGSPTARYAILDYKTGAAADRAAGAHRPVAAAHARSGDAARRRLSPASPPARSVAELVYVRLKRRRAGRRANARSNSRTATPDDAGRRRAARLTGVAAPFEIEATPYRSLVHPMWKHHYGDL